ncbi:MAG: hypothetical protein ACI808_001967 [Paraglaciecola sp.]
MDTFDYVIMTVGGALTIIGLILFVLGKKEGGSNNNVEGFGIKLNVSNPSIILIVFGVGLLLVPRLLPNNRLQNEFEPGPRYEQPAKKDEVFVPAKEPEQEQEPQAEDYISPVPPSVFFPRGMWHLTSYSESGQDLSNNINGTINFTRQSAQSVGWVSNFKVNDEWGNYIGNYQYQGSISTDGNYYSMLVVRSNDPNFIRQGAIALELLAEDGGVLHMRYLYLGSEILVHFRQ